MRRYKIDYNQKCNCFKEIKNIETKLIYGDLSFIKKPFISYIVPVYKRADLLEKTLNSIIQQKRVSFEWDIVVVDNEAGEKNATEVLIKKIDNKKILYYRNAENLGPDGNYNRCIEIARGEWLAMLHGDDLIMNDHLQEMGRLIKEYIHKGNNPSLAYICQRYIEFSDEKKVFLDRKKVLGGNSITSESISIVLNRDYNDGKLEILTQSYGVMTGFFAALPSFGTIMNKDIMLREGGFNKHLGICEDVITPYKLAAKYSVCMAPKIMGYYRFNNNESMKIETIYRIYESMVDFREYMYSRNILTRIWGEIARDILNKGLRNYCVMLSRFASKQLKISDFDIHSKLSPVSPIKLKLFEIIIKLFNHFKGLSEYDEVIINLIRFEKAKIEKHYKENGHFIIYGAGRVAKVMVPLLKKDYKGIKIDCILVSDKNNCEEAKICGIDIIGIDECIEKGGRIVITATEIWEYQEAMNKKLMEYGFLKKINLLR